MYNNKAAGVTLHHWTHEGNIVNRRSRFDRPKKGEKAETCSGFESVIVSEISSSQC